MADRCSAVPIALCVACLHTSGGRALCWRDCNLLLMWYRYALRKMYHRYRTLYVGGYVLAAAYRTHNLPVRLMYSMYTASVQVHTAQEVFSPVVVHSALQLLLECQCWNVGMPIII